MGREVSRQLSFTDLTLGEVFSLIRYYFTVIFVELLVFGLPWAIFSGFDLGLRSTLSEGSCSWWSRAFGYGILALIAYLILKDVPHVFHYFGDMLTQFGNLASRLSRPSQIMLILFIVGYFVAWTKYPTLTFFFTIVVMIPAGFTYDRYVQVLKGKSSDGDDDDQRIPR